MSNVFLGADFKNYRRHYAYAGLRTIWAIIKGDRKESEEWYKTWMI